METRPERAPALTYVLLAGLAANSGCGGGAKPGTLVGTYAVHGVLVENSCGQTALPTSNPLDFVVEVREDEGIAYWMPTKSAQNTGTLSDTGTFRFTMSRTQVVEGGSTAEQLEPIDFQTMRGDFDLAQKRTCALTLKETVTGSLQRRIEGGQVSYASADDDAATADDLSAEHLIQVTPSAGSDCTAALAALGGSFVALPCEAQYVLTGSLDTTDAVDPHTSQEDDLPDAATPP